MVGSVGFEPTKAFTDRFTVCSHWPLGQLPRPSETIPDRFRPRQAGAILLGMTDLHAAWSLSRGRYLDEIAGLDAAGLNFRLYPGALTIGEAAIHVAGIEARFASGIDGLVLDPFLERVRRAATEGVVNDAPFPFPEAEITPELVARALDASKAIWEPIVLEPTPARRAVPLVSVLGPAITGEGAMARLAFHAAYHQGQAYQIKNAPGFPV